MQQRKNKWLIVAAAIGIHISIGSVYAWSVLTRPLMEALGATMQEITWAFSLAIFCLGSAAGLLGTYVEQLGPRKSGLLATVFFASGLLGTAYAVSVQSLTLMYLSYGFIGGIGLGVGYLAPVATLVKWFPNNRGLATGLAIMGFGFASLVAGPLMQILLAKFGVVQNFVILACIYAVVMTASSLYLAPPLEEAKPTLKNKQEHIVAEEKQYTVQEAMHTWRFYLMWLMFFINTTCGIALLAVVSPMAQTVVGMSPLAAASMVGIIGVLNGSGRIMWSTISDYVGRINTYIAFFVIQIIAFFLLASTKDVLLFQVLLFIIVTCYGGGFSCMPAFLSDIYGTKQLSAIYGRILTAWAVAGFVGPYLLARFYAISNAYAEPLYFFSACFVVSLAIALILKFKK